MSYKDWPWDTRSGKFGQAYYTEDNPKVCLHTTETKGFPNYEWPPHITYLIDEDRGRWHVPAKLGAYALKSPGGGRSPNYQAGPVFQIEIVSYAKDSAGKPDWWYSRLSNLISEVCADLGVAQVLHPKGFVRTGAYGANGVNRLTWDQFKSFTGVLGHQHVTANAHWDPGDLDETRLKLTGSTPVPVPPTQPLENDMTSAQEAKLDALTAAVAALSLKVDRLPNETWKFPQKSDPAVVSTFQMQLRTWVASQRPTATSAELDAAVAEIIAAMPEDIQVDVKVSGPS